MRARFAGLGLFAGAVVMAACSGGGHSNAAPDLSDQVIGVPTTTPPAAIAATPTPKPKPSKKPTTAAKKSPAATVATQPTAVHKRKPATTSTHAASSGSGGSLAGCTVLASNNVLATPITGLPLNARNAAWKSASHASGRNLHPDFGPSYGAQPVPYGLPWQVVSNAHQKVTVKFQYASESDKGPYPLGSDTPIEGGSNASGDRHALVINKDTCKLYETFDTHYAASGSHAGSGAIFSLGSNAMRPATWTSADAAGLPIFPLLLRWDEVKAGAVRHAIRFTVSSTDTRYVWPASHQAGSASNQNLPPMGARARLSSSFSTSGFSSYARTVIKAMQTYGVIVADNGSDWYFQGDASTGWPDSVISELKRIPAGTFDFVDESSLQKSAGSYAVK
ncbi:MAG: hypothetical protein QOG53_2104 [Frankiales bacterium]|jgi:hypothetical protein|nr:hypothetical protein [Frankiales bacterium]